MPWKQFDSQPLVAQLFKRTLENNRIHHAYLLIGDELETDPLAMGFAQAANCEKQNGDFCGQCQPCQWITKGQHPDVRTVCPESRSRRILISQVRELERSIFLKASHARTKVVTIHAADRLQPEAQDAFLKTLEEPPASTLFLLLTEEPQQLRETILSRCLHVPFLPSRKQKKTPHYETIETWLNELTEASSDQTQVFRAYGLAGKVLGLLKEIKDTKLEEAKQALDQPSFDELEASQRERLEEQAAAQAQADYLSERTLILKTMLEWFHTNNPHPKTFRIFENLSSQLNRNINETLSLEMAVLELAKTR